MRAVALLALLAASGAQAQVDRIGPVMTPGLPVVDQRAPQPLARTRSAAPDCNPATEGARFEVEYIGFPAAAEVAFQTAVDTWACRVRSSQIVRVQATWAELDATTLGSAGPILYRNFPGAPARNVWYPAALADALAERDLGEGDPDIEAIFNSDFGSWHFGPGAPPAGTYDLATVVLHELGHGLGVIGSLQVKDGVGVLSVEGEFPFSYDLHVQDPSGTSLLDSSTYPLGSARLAQALVSELRFGGRAIEQVSETTVPLYAPPQWTPGGSLSHLAEDAFAAGTPDGLMTPFIAREEVVTEPGAVVCALLADVGWTLAGDCADRVGGLVTTEPSLSVQRLGPNPTSTETVLRVSSTATVTLRARLVDVLGRVLDDYGSTVLIDGRQLDLRVRADGRASGIYFVLLEGAADPVSVPLTIVR